MPSKMVSLHNSIYDRRKRQKYTFNRVFLSCYFSVLDDRLKQVLREITLSISANSE